MTGDQTRPGPPEGRAVETPVQAAWRAYMDHTRDCEECGRRLYNCPDGKQLWEAYREVRGPMEGPFTGRRDGAPIPPGRSA